MSDIDLTWGQALAWRLTRHGLAAADSVGAVAPLVHRICGLHAQVMSCAELAAGVRDEAVPPAVVRAALAGDRKLVKTWLMRGTLHLAAASDLPTYVAALRPESFHLRPQWLRENKLTVEQAVKLVDLVPKVLRGQCLTREELAEQVGKAMRDESLAGALRSGFGEVLKPVAFHGGLCFGPNRGRLVTFVHPQDWLSGIGAEPDADEARSVVLRDFLATHGPAAKGDFAHWWGMSRPRAQQVRDQLGDEIVDVTIDGRPAWVLAKDLADIRSSEESHTLRLLPGFDPYVVTAGRDVEYIVSAAEKSKVYKFAGWFAPVVLVGGRVVGTWSHKAGKRLKITVDPFRKLNRAQLRSLDTEAGRIAALLGGEPELTIA